MTLGMAFGKGVSTMKMIWVFFLFCLAEMREIKKGIGDGDENLCGFGLDGW